MSLTEEELEMDVHSMMNFRRAVHKFLEPFLNAQWFKELTPQNRIHAKKQIEGLVEKFVDMKVEHGVVQRVANQMLDRIRQGKAVDVDFQKARIETPDYIK